MITIKLKTEEEAQVLLNFIDAAVRANGRVAAEACIMFTKDIEEASRESRLIKTEETK